MNCGKIKFFKIDKGYGFITENETNNEYFFHVVDCKSKGLEKGQDVSFDLDEGKRGLRAVNVKLII